MSDIEKLIQIKKRQYCMKKIYSLIPPISIRVRLFVTWYIWRHVEWRWTGVGVDIFVGLQKCSVIMANCLTMPWSLVLCFRFSKTNYNYITGFISLFLLNRCSVELKPAGKKDASVRIFSLHFRHYVIMLFHTSLFKTQNINWM